MGLGARSCMRKGFLIYEEMRKYFTIYEEDVSKTLNPIPYILGQFSFLFYQGRQIDT